MLRGFTKRFGVPRKVIIHSTRYGSSADERPIQTNHIGFINCRTVLVTRISHESIVWRLRSECPRICAWRQTFRRRHMLIIICNQWQRRLDNYRAML